ncbi:MAG: HD domain-containing protein [Desulfovibrionaceae bacterium]|nr:HD domain-containing protein [Desulfovibrionaceae bacterium]
MGQPFKDAVGICKTIMRNGYDAYVVNARLQELTLEGPDRESALDICTELGLEDLRRLFPGVQASAEETVTGTLSQAGVTYYFYPADVADAAHPDETVALFTPRMLKVLEKKGETPLSSVCPLIPRAKDMYEGFADLSEGFVSLKGLPDQTLKRDYVLAVRALRFAANYNLAVEANTWMAIVRGARRVTDYVSVSEIMDEWRKVEAENMWLFAKLLFDSQIMHSLIPEIAALSRVRQIKNPDEGEESVLDHTLEVMRRYPEELPYDWYGTMACLFHDVGKLYTAEYSNGQWSFLQHHRVGAKVTRKILTRLRFAQEDIDLICFLVRHHMRFHFMLTDKGIRRFKSLDEYPRLIEIFRADLKARNGSYREFNHNMKMLERADMPEEVLEPLLNGNEIMQATGLRPGPAVGVMREALLKAQIAGDVTGPDEAREFVKRYKETERLG